MIRKLFVFLVFFVVTVGITFPAFAAAPVPALVEGANGSKPAPKVIQAKPSFSLQSIKLCLTAQFSEDDMKNFSAGINPSENEKAIMSNCLSSLIKSLLVFSGSFNKFPNISENQSITNQKNIKAETVPVSSPTSLINPLNLMANIAFQFLGLIFRDN